LCVDEFWYLYLTEMIQVYEAARWALKKVNDINYVPGIKLGKQVLQIWK